ncbi:ATP-binding cassette domain-containing protein [Micromonospora sp. NPDC047465]|uniref:ATP-binding cassette domain-containing protein n=1 Tax=Micromonospora sp. NPDC047465 TaxID=3154813 RepID=UPI0033EA572B
MDDPVIGHGLAQRYGKRNVFRNLDVVVPRGVTVLLGPNGAGKTTLLHTIVGLKRPVEG